MRRLNTSQSSGRLRVSVDIAFYYYLDLGILQLTLEAAGRNLRVRKFGYTGAGSPGNDNNKDGVKDRRVGGREVWIVQQGIGVIYCYGYVVIEDRASSE